MTELQLNHRTTFIIKSKSRLFFLGFILLVSGMSVFSQVAINTDASPPDASAMLDVKSTSKGFLPPRMTTAQRDLISSPANGLIIFNITNNRNETYNGTTWVGNTHYIGETYSGGIVFYVYDGGQHGLIAATEDQSTGITWYNGTYKLTGTTGDGLNAGIMNTAMIVAEQMADNTSGNFAAKICADYSVTAGGVTYGDWYLPSTYELNLLYLQKSVVGGFATYVNYWSSSEYTASTAWHQTFDDGYQGHSGKHATYYVRAVRAF
jgi:hypothetical protein